MTLPPRQKPPLLPLPLVAAVLLSAATPTLAQDTGVPVTFAPGKDYTRIIFDFPAMTGYEAKSTDGKLTLTFNTEAAFRLPAGKAKGIRAIRAEGKTVTIDLDGNAGTRDYRLLRKVVVDVMTKPPAPAVAMTPPPQKEKEKEKAAPPVTAAPAKPVEQAPLATEKPAEKAPEKTAPEKTTNLPDNMLIDRVTAAEIEGGGSVETPPEMMDRPPTTLTLSTLEPVRLAVFTRNSTLWVVLDSQTPGVQPAVAGTLAGSLGRPRVLSFKGGTAYLYPLPQGQYVSVNKQGINWQVALTSSPVQGFSERQPAVAIDGSSGRARLIVPLAATGAVMEIEDPVAGDRLHVIPVSTPDERVDRPRRYPELEILPAYSGMVVRPAAAGVRVNRLDNIVLIAADTGINATPGAPVASVRPTGDGAAAAGARLFDFPNWRQGGMARLNVNRRQLEADIAKADPAEVQGLTMRLALLYFANNFGQETLAVLRMLEQDDEKISRNPNFVALRGAAAAMAGHYQDALKDLTDPLIADNPEVRLWAGYVAASTEQWRMAARLFPGDTHLLTEYPPNIAVPFTLYMAESALRLGNTDTAKKLLSSLDTAALPADAAHLRAAAGYLRGELARQEGDFEAAMKHWRPVANGLDQLYHTKAALALAMLEMQQKAITPAAAADTIDSLRFAWRGDGLEVQVLHALGLLRIENRQYLQGLESLKAAADLADQMLLDSEPIREDIGRTIDNVFSGNPSPAMEIEALEAVSIYNVFGNLIPPGEAGSAAMLKVADYMISIDLLEKAEKIMEEQLTQGYLPAEKIGPTATRLAAVYLMDARPAEALSALDRTDGAPMTDKMRAERVLLRARAQSQMKQTAAAIETLSALDSLDAKRLKADVLWRARDWAGAAAAIEAMLPAGNAELTPAEAELVVNAAVAYKLAGDAAGLQSLRERYQGAMAKTPSASTFGVVTRTGGASSLADRDTILRISGEVDMFRGFLDSYKAEEK